MKLILIEADIFYCYFRGLTLLEIMEELDKHQEEDLSDLSDENDNTAHKENTEIFIVPPIDGQMTDEDSGEEDVVTIDNLPGTQLIAEAFVENKNAGSNKIIKTKKKLKLREWKTNDLSVNVKSEVCYPYKPSVADKPREPFEIFELFFDVSAIDYLTKETVRYAIHRGKHSFELRSEELKAFLGILIVSGYNTVPRRRMYWQNESDVRNDLIANSMRRDRFEEIFRFLHAADNNNITPDDKYSKVRPFLDILNGRFMSYGSPFGPKNISIDESMIPYYGRHPTKQFIRGKPIRWGYKAWVAADPLGYAYFIDLYQGQNESNSAYRETFGLGGAVILCMVDRLEKNYPETKFSLYFDNYFTSVKLLEEITGRGHGATGTLRSNRVEKCPFTNSKSFSKKPRGSVEFHSNEDLTVVLARWNDNGLVTIGSNEHGVYPMAKAERYSQAVRKRVNIDMPSLIKYYNINMGGVDRLDQNVSQYRSTIRGKKWYIPIIIYLLNVSMNNAWLFARSGGYKDDLLSFTRSVAQKWLNSYGIQQKNAGRPKLLIESKHFSLDQRYDNIGHAIVTSNPLARRRCKQCKSHTVYRCNKCHVHLHLKCSSDYHTK